MFAVEIRDITKTYPGVVALDRVSLKIESGHCHALMGENGAGKSTLGKILAGLTSPDSGQILLFDKQVRLNNPLVASRLGIAIVHQELIAFANMTVEENLVMEDIPHRGPFVDRRAMREHATLWLERVNADVEPSTRLGDLQPGVQQLVLIAGALAKGAKVIVFDEPTSSLSNREANVLFDQIEKLKTAGVTCIYVSHRMDEIFRLCDTVSVLRDGKHVATEPASELDDQTLVRMMIGREIQPSGASSAPVGDVRLEVSDFNSPNRFRDIRFTLSAGEILGFAGLIGSGRTEIAEALFGLDPASKGDITVNGNRVHPSSPRQMMTMGLGLVPEDRKTQGLILSMNARENITLPTLQAESVAGWVQGRKEMAVATEYFTKLNVKALSTESPTLSLSGGNQQKLVLAKWLAANCDVLILDEPTRGVDVGAKAEIHELVRELAVGGKAVLVISSELPEILSLCTRIFVLREGRIVGELSAKGATEAGLLSLMTGAAG
jgi:ABC-type sugar transport system ATPase subunit